MCVCQREEHTEFFSVTLSNASLDREVQLKEENGGPSDATVLPTDHSRSVARIVPSSTNMLQLRELSRECWFGVSSRRRRWCTHDGSRTHARRRRRAVLTQVMSQIMRQVTVSGDLRSWNTTNRDPG